MKDIQDLQMSYTKTRENSGSKKGIINLLFVSSFGMTNEYSFICMANTFFLKFRAATLFFFCFDSWMQTIH